MNIVFTQPELIAQIEEIKKEARFKLFLSGDTINVGKISVGSESPPDFKYAWTHYHATLNFQGYRLDIKVPTISGNLTTKFRYFDEAKFNESFIVPETNEETVQREIETYRKLHREGFPTLEPMNHLLNHGPKDVLITRKVDNPKHMIDLVATADMEDCREYVSEIAKLMKRLHERHGTIWGDPWLGNTFYDKERLYLFDFGFRPNPGKTAPFLRGKDLVSLCISAVYRTEKDSRAIIYAVLDAYNPNGDVRKEMKCSLEKTMSGREFPLQIIESLFYHGPVFGMTSSRVNDIKKEIYKQIS